jgi:hypothetical protein
MLFINPEVYPTEDVLHNFTQQDTPSLIDAQQMAPQLDGARTADIATSLKFVDYIQEDIGGQTAIENLIGWSTGIVPMNVRNRPFDGRVLTQDETPFSAAIFASEQYGDVGTDHSNQTRVAQVNFTDSVYTPNEQNAADSFIAPGFIIVPEVAP